jgi:hypothetical protein
VYLYQEICLTQQLPKEDMKEHTMKEAFNAE